MNLINPAELGAPSGYSNGALVPKEAQILFVAGQIGWNRDQELVSDGFAAQFEQALRNVVTVVVAAGGTAENLARLTFFVTDKQEYLENLEILGLAYRRIMGRHFPAMTLVEVQALVEPGAKIEVEGTAAIV